MKSTPIEDLIDESVTDEEEMERDISSIANDIKNSSTMHESGVQFQNEIDSMRNQLEELKRQQNQGAPPPPSTSTATKIRVVEEAENIFESIFRYKKIEDIIEIVSLICVYVIFTLNAFVDFIDNMIPYMFYHYNPIIKGLLFVIVYRAINFFLIKLLKNTA